MSTQAKTRADAKAALAALEQAYAYYDDAPRQAQAAPVQDDSYFEYVKAA
ncbi:hypothetical protein SAMN05216196_104253 [Lutimaribacter pacificus]|uniref:Uncharacterized protein n=1 Tax=Lutimaribacter pacificus TaxID=391948 RepID=A0A1H0I5J7_9RHOB|nr:hypothetical protein [Lutimaribacter pacificus]SDO26682.1 hypothetical protein SAMN05216196_104253 [Lutimaribacter pacificus]SHK26086.1 hypothetical protein SAMN05444142_104132 [Lutimaribacter pacificus]